MSCNNCGNFDVNVFKHSESFNRYRIIVSCPVCRNREMFEYRWYGEEWQESDYMLINAGKDMDAGMFDSVRNMEVEDDGTF